MGVPEQDEEAHPTRRYGWIHTMTCPRELSLRHGRLHQRPARELQQLRGEREDWRGRADDAPTYALGAAELQLTPQGAFSAAFGDAMTLNWDGERLQLTRASGRRPAGAPLLARPGHASAAALRSLQRGDLHQPRRGGDERATSRQVNRNCG